MDDFIPKDVMLAARECVLASFSDPLSPMQIYIAHAILAERRRCAEVAKAYLEDLAGCGMRDEEPELLADAIMKGSR